MSVSARTYLIKNSTDHSVIGVYSQIQEFSRTHVVPQKLYFEQDELGKFDDDIEFPVYRMQSKAKLTDLISNVPLSINLMISTRCLKLFEKMKLPDYQVFPLKFIYKGNLNLDYYAFSIVRQISFLNYISWEHSRFYKTTNWHRNLIEEYSFNSTEEVLKNQKEFSDAGFGLKVEIKLLYQNDYDIIDFSRYPMNVGFLCSEHAKNKIIDAGLSGFDFEELPSTLFLEL